MGAGSVSLTLWLRDPLLSTPGLSAESEKEAISYRAQWWVEGRPAMGGEAANGEDFLEEEAENQRRLPSENSRMESGASSAVAPPGPREHESEADSPPTPSA